MNNKRFIEYYNEDRNTPIADDMKTESSPDPPQKETITEHKQVEVIVEKNEENLGLLVESVVSSNQKLVEFVQQSLADNKKTNDMLAEAILTLSNKIELLEQKIEVIKNVELPAPIVNVSVPNRRVVKEVHRDDKGFITHIVEQDASDESNDAN